MRSEIDPTRVPTRLTLREYLRTAEGGLTALAREFGFSILGVVAGLIIAYVLDSVYGATSRLDVAAEHLLRHAAAHQAGDLRQKLVA